MKILVTGSAGTLGRVLVAELRRRGHQVFGCDLKHSDDPQEMRADVSERRQLARVFDAFGPFDLCYHLAAEFGRLNGEEFYEDLWKSNCIGTRNVIEECIRTGTRLAFASSSEAYGETATYQPDKDGLLPESLLDAFAPAFHNEYALTKWANERQIHIAAKNRGLNAVVLRFFNAYGPGEYYTPYRSVVCLFIYRLMFGLPITVYSNYHRVFMYVDDWARTVANVADRFDSLPREARWIGSRWGMVPTYNVGGEEYCSVETMKDKIVALLGGTQSEISHLDAEKANVTNKRPDITLAKRDLGHDPKTTLDEGLPITIEWMRRTYDTGVLFLGHHRFPCRWSDDDIAALHAAIEPARPAVQ